MATPSKKNRTRGLPRTLGLNPVSLTVMVRADQMKQWTRSENTRPAPARPPSADSWT
jgi:hypothetical protein